MSEPKKIKINVDEAEDELKELKKSGKKKEKTKKEKKKSKKNSDIKKKNIIKVIFSAIIAFLSSLVFYLVVLGVIGGIGFLAYKVYDQDKQRNEDLEIIRDEIDEKLTLLQGQLNGNPNVTAVTENTENIQEETIPEPELDTSNWQEYYNKLYQIKLKYPADWKMITYEEDKKVIFKSPDYKALSNGTGGTFDGEIYFSIYDNPDSRSYKNLLLDMGMTNWFDGHHSYQDEIGEYYVKRIDNFIVTPGNYRRTEMFINDRNKQIVINFTYLYDKKPDFEAYPEKMIELMENLPIPDIAKPATEVLEQQQVQEQETEPETTPET